MVAVRAVARPGPAEGRKPGRGGRPAARSAALEVSTEEFRHYRLAPWARLTRRPSRALPDGLAVDYRDDLDWGPNSRGYKSQDGQGTSALPRVADPSECDPSKDHTERPYPGQPKYK